MTLTASIRAAINAQLAKSLDLAAPSANPKLEFLTTLADGVDVGEVDKVFADTRTLADGATEDLDFGSGGGLADVLGDAFSGSVAEIVAIIAFALAANSTNITLGAAAAEQHLLGFGAATHTWKLTPGGIFLAYDPAGWAVSNNTTDKLKAANAAGAAGSYSILLLGRSA